MPSRWSRRRFLGSGCAIALAGCTGSEPTDARPSVSLDVEVLHSFTGDRPARLRVELSNDGDRTLVIRWNASEAQAGPINAVWGSHRTTDATLGVFRRDGWAARCMPADTAPPVPADPVDGCWRPPCEEIDLPSIHGRSELSPDEPEADEYVLLDGFNRECLPAGSYEFDGSRGNVSASLARGAVVDGDVRTDSEWAGLQRRLTVAIDENREVSASAEATVDSGK